MVIAVVEDGLPASARLNYPRLTELAQMLGQGRLTDLQIIGQLIHRPFTLRHPKKYAEPDRIGQTCEYVRSALQRDIVYVLTGLSLEIYRNNIHAFVPLNPSSFSFTLIHYGELLVNAKQIRS